MEKSESTPWKNKTWITGICLTVLSTALFLLPNLLPPREDLIGIFIGNYGFVVVYTIILIGAGILKFRKGASTFRSENIAILLALSLISCFSLNREINVFQQSTYWLQIDIVLLCISLIGIAFRKISPSWYSHILFFLLGNGLVLSIYYSIYLLPFLPVGILVSFLFGLSLHLIVPLLIVLFIIRYLIKNWSSDKNPMIAFSIGAGLSILFAVVFIVKYNRTNNTINEAYQTAIIEGNNALPVWVQLSQKLKADWFTEKVIKTDLLYLAKSNSGSLFSFPELRSFEDVKEHDPLVFTASVFSAKSELAIEDKIKILESIYDGRHIAQERLWSGVDLTTESVITDVLIYPKLRLGYTEKIFTIRNNQVERNWNREQEAIYTFNLQEGSVVTSLSLWINGKEEKGILTTKAKADSAYKTIVGVEVRDPSVIHWQEGNTVSVRIFPCTPTELRRFKIGITSPLVLENNKLYYKNINFKGPNATGANETINLRFSDSPKNLLLPEDFATTNLLGYKRSAAYNEDWQLEFENSTVPSNSFSFNGNKYKIEEYQRTYESYVPDRIYLDLNAKWTRNEFDTLWSQLKGKKLYVITNEIEAITNENKDEIFNRLQSSNFSLFPFYKATGVNPLVITKNPENTPNLQDLKTSGFGLMLIDYLKNQHSISLYNIGTLQSPYLKTLKELRAFNFDQGSLKELQAILSENKFIKAQENENSVTIFNSALTIQKAQGADQITAPDHLMRLFEYNNIMRIIGKDYFSNSYLNEDVIRKAQEAYVVTPVSSLIVLETQDDYKRFGIKDLDNSLKNASTKSSGAVPEPEEWALILLSIIIIGYFLYKEYKAKKYA